MAIPKNKDVVKIKEVYRITDGKFKIYISKDVENNKFSVITDNKEYEFVFKLTKKENIEKIGKLLTKISKL